VPADAPAPADPLAPLAGLPEVIAAVDDARRAVDRLLAHPVLRRRGAEVTAEALLRAARASAALEGADLPLDRLRAQLVAGEGVAGDAGPVVEAALRLHAELGALMPAWARAPRQVLARLHVLACAGLLPDEQLGRPRPDPLPANADPLRLGPAPEPTAVAARLGALSDLLTTPTLAPAPVVAAVTHGELLALRPFAAGNGLVARAAARLVLMGRGLDPKAVAVPEVGHEELAEEYAAAARGYAAGGRRGVVMWVAHCCHAVMLGAREGIAICEALQRSR
jgi:Fic family protein